MLDGVGWGVVDELGPGRGGFVDELGPGRGVGVCI